TTRNTAHDSQSHPAFLDVPMGDLYLCHRLVEDRHYVLERPVGNGGAIEHSVESELGVDRREVREFDDALGFLDLQEPAVDDLRDMGEEPGDAERAGWLDDTGLLGG